METIKKEKEEIEQKNFGIKKYEKEYRRDMEDVRRQKKEEETFRRGELPGRFIAKRLFGWSDKEYDKEY